MKVVKALESRIIYLADGDNVIKSHEENIDNTRDELNLKENMSKKFFKSLFHFNTSSDDSFRVLNICCEKMFLLRLIHENKYTDFAKKGNFNTNMRNEKVIKHLTVQLQPKGNAPVKVEN